MEHEGSAAQEVRQGTLGQAKTNDKDVLKGRCLILDSCLWIEPWKEYTLGVAYELGSL